MSNIINELKSENGFTYLFTDTNEYCVGYDIATTKSILSQINPHWQKRGLKIKDDLGCIADSKKLKKEFEGYIKEAILKAHENNIHFINWDVSLNLLTPYVKRLLNNFKSQVFYIAHENSSTIRLIPKVRIINAPDEIYHVLIQHHLKTFCFVFDSAGLKFEEKQSEVCHNIKTKKNETYIFRY